MGDRLYRKPGNPIWYGVVYDKAGHRHRVSTKVTDKRAAEAVVRRLEREHHSDNPLQGAPRHTIEEALNYLQEVRGERSSHYSDRAKPLVRLLGDKDVNILRLEDLDRYIKTRLAEQRPGKDPERSTISRGTVAKELATLGTALRLCAKRGIFQKALEAIFPDFSAPYVPRKRHLTADEVRRLAAELQPRRLLWVVVAIYTGGRRTTEVERLEWSDLDWEENAIHLPGSKTESADRIVPFHLQLRGILEPRRFLEDGEARRGKIVEAWPSQTRDLEAACKRAGIEKATANDLRRTFASWLISAHVPNSIVARLLGHTTTAMVDRVYGKHTTAALAMATDKLPGVTLVPKAPTPWPPGDN